MVEDRKLAVLRAIVEDYVSTEEPVGSKALVERHRLGVSPATVRNDMAVLEEEGFITQPHTSAGRVPTDKGYRLFVDRLTTVKPMSAAEKRAIATFLDGRGRPRRRGPPQRAAAVAAHPAGRGRAVPHALPHHRPPRRGGRAHPEPAAAGADPEHRPGRAAPGRAARRARRRRRSPTCAPASTGPSPARPSPTPPAGSRRSPSEVPPSGVRRPVRSSPRSSRRCPTTAPTSGSLVGGTANLTRFGEGFDTTIRPLLEALEEHVVLLKLLGEAGTGGTVTVRIGDEGPYQELASTSVVATGYGPGDQALATLGIVGPTRMDYPGTMAAVRAVARYVSRILDEA